LDKLIGSIKHFQEWKMIDIPSLFSPRFDEVNIFYSSPEYYTKCKYEELIKSRNQNIGEANDASSSNDVEYGVKMDDFFPYSDREHGFWTGYFTSRASLKRQERVASSFLLAARQIESLLDFDGNPSDPKKSYGSFHELEDAVGVLQHHDGVSGTAKQHVANDYSKRLQSGIDQVIAGTTAKLRRLFLGNNASDYLPDLSLCQRLNETVCGISQVSFVQRKARPYRNTIQAASYTFSFARHLLQEATMEPNITNVYVMVYNGLGRSQSSVVFLPVSSIGSYSVWNVGSPNGTASLVSSIPSLKSTTAEAAKYVLPLDTGALPALGASVFRVGFLGDSDYLGKRSSTETDVLVPAAPVDERSLRTSMRYNKNGDVEFSNGLIQVLFDGYVSASPFGVTSVLEEYWTDVWP
jgi:hypothetical protein